LALKDFVDKESASIGANISAANKAIEIALWHANNEIYSPSDGGEPVSLSFSWLAMPQPILKKKS
jgi:hypothetical protein